MVSKVEDIVLGDKLLVNQLVVLMKMKIITKHGEWLTLIDCEVEVVLYQSMFHQ
jgi:hypothetical protein